jgi:hypothetical protein
MVHEACSKFIEARPVVKDHSVTEEQLALARSDPEFRRRLLANKLDHLLAELARMRASNAANRPEPARQIREGVDLAVKIAHILQQSRDSAPS